MITAVLTVKNQEIIKNLIGHIRSRKMRERGKGVKYESQFILNLFS